ncbi:MOSC domain-containing protein [Roseibium sp. RKSG952]|uniref:MOSC domain-containing protein n=1 Tax=Roseibium sp. RKSG952 TaxID=2529384 RepID=UPI0012BD3FEB|nr:MOSC domain-containing protein [Roseibium sp. RKSG952]MTH98167.1 MOSC domain-containing protein [Roseibium sp. RKSG952]
MTISGQLLQLFTGKPEHLWNGKPMSAIRKLATSAELHTGLTGLEGDQQADLTVHGGPDKALHLYPSEHLAGWRGEFPEKADVFQPGGFGENLSTTGLTEENTCIGDVFSIGTARIQISQGRQPCWKLNMHTGIDAMAPRFQRTAKTGWYFRVLEEGWIKAGDDINLLERIRPDWPMKRLIEARFNPKLDPRMAAELADLEVLADNWRAAFLKKCDTGFREDTNRRLKGS